MNHPKDLLDRMRDMRRQLLQGSPHAASAATAAIQKALQDAGLAAAPGAPAPTSSRAAEAAQSPSAAAPAPGPVMHDINPPPAGKAAHPAPGSAMPAGQSDRPAGDARPARPAGSAGTAATGGSGEFVNGLLAKLKAATDGLAQGATAGRPAQAMPDGARFIGGSFANGAGSRQFKLYVPASAAAGGGPLPLVVMLHGCTQDPDDFAAGTQMNAAAEAQACLVLYPQQAQSANSSKCWNWFHAGDQQRDAGEPSIIAGMTRQVMAQYAVDPAQVYVAGLSAGGAMAAIMGIAYPDLYAGVAVHSGLPYGAATDLQSALAAMRSGVAGAAPQARGQRFKGIPVIVFHGDADHTVNRRNGEQVIEATAPPSAGVPSRTDGQVPNGHAYTRTVHRDAAGVAVAEHWLIHGFGHAWAGGSAHGSYTDARGPDATGEMLRFFKTHRKPS